MLACTQAGAWMLHPHALKHHDGRKVGECNFQELSNGKREEQEEEEDYVLPLLYVHRRRTLVGVARTAPTVAIFASFSLVTSAILMPALVSSSTDCDWCPIRRRGT